MIQWNLRPQEEKCLLNPSFCSLLLWYGANGFLREDSRRMTFEESFLIVPIVLHRSTRELLPLTIRTSLPTWLDENRLIRSNVATRTRLLVPYVKEAITFGLRHNLLHIEEGEIIGNDSWKKSVAKTMRESTDEVIECTKRSEFVGRWFSQAGSASTVFALFGVRP